MSLAKAVANAAAMLVLKAKNVAQVAEDTVLQNRVIAAATQCALSTSQLVACAKVSRLACQPFLQCHIVSPVTRHSEPEVWSFLPTAALRGHDRIVCLFRFGAFFCFFFCRSGWETRFSVCSLVLLELSMETSRP